MVAQITQFTLPVPDILNQSREEFEPSINTLVGELPRFVTEQNTAISEMNALSLNAEAAAGELANAVWVTGTTYAAGNVRYSPVDSFSYRRKTAGAGSTDPSLDPVNWALQTKTSAGGSDTTSSAVDIALTSASGRLQVIDMTASNKKVTLPAATSLSKGAHVFVIKNTGVYRFAARKNGGVFLCYINPGQVIAFGCSDISTSAGVWTVSGGAVSNIYDGNTAEVLNAVDSRYIAVAMLSATKAICAYKNNSTGYLWAVILNFGSASGTPAAITAEAVKNISIAAQTSNQATVVYQISPIGTTVKGYVLDVSGNTITPGAVATIATNASNGYEGTSLSFLSSTKLLLAYYIASTSNVLERVLDISGSTITASGAVNADTSATTITLSLLTLSKTVSATKAVVAFIGTSNQLLIRLQSITVSTPAPTGTVLSISGVGSPPGTSFAMTVMNSNRAVIIRSIDRLYGDFVVYLIDISGTTPVLVASKHISVGISGTGSNISAAKLDSSRIYVTWAGGYSLGVDSMVLTITSDDRVIESEISERLESGVTSAFGYLACDALDSAHVLQVCRNASTFLSAKTIEVN